MSTRSSITIVKKGINGDHYKGVYCHSDGYLSYNGAILLEHYNTQEKVEELISHGDLSYLAEKINPNPAYEHSFDGERQDGVCLYYGRDRGEKWEQVKPVEADSEKEFYERMEQEYNYLFKDGKWYYYEEYGSREWRELTEEDCR